MLLAKYKKRYPLEVQITWFCFWNGINTLEFSVLRFLGSLSIKWNVPLAMVCESVCRCVHRNGKVGGKEDISCHWNMHMHALLGHLPRMLYLIFGQTLCMYTSLLLSVASDFSLSLHISSTAMRSLLKTPQKHSWHDYIKMVTSNQYTRVYVHMSRPQHKNNQDRGLQKHRRVKETSKICKGDPSSPLEYFSIRWKHCYWLQSVSLSYCLCMLQCWRIDLRREG